MKLVADSRVHGQVGIAGEARFAPALDGDAADEAEPAVATPTATAKRVPCVAALRAGARSRAMSQQALSDARTKVSESPFVELSADGAIQAGLRSSESAGAKPAMRRATAGSLRTLVPQLLLLRADEGIQ